MAHANGFDLPGDSRYVSRSASGDTPSSSAASRSGLLGLTRSHPALLISKHARPAGVPSGVLGSVYGIVGASELLLESGIREGESVTSPAEPVHFSAASSLGCALSLPRLCFVSAGAGMTLGTSRWCGFWC